MTTCLGCRWLELEKATLLLVCRKHGGTGKTPEPKTLGKGGCER